MQKLFTARSIAVVALIAALGGPAAVAQNSRGTSGASNSPIPQAPVGHRQPRASDVPNEKNLSNPNDPLSKEDAALDKKIKSICRGC
jgi:hypothetical protein